MGKYMHQPLILACQPKQCSNELGQARVGQFAVECGCRLQPVYEVVNKKTESLQVSGICRISIFVYRDQVIHYLLQENNECPCSL
jgi:hypothetical protein